MGRTRGYWWAPDGTALLVARVDSTPVHRWYIADPANPARPAAEVAYPAAGTPNADVTLVLAGLDGSRCPLDWDRAGFPYLVTVNWDGDGPLIVVQSRDQRRMLLLSADPARAATAVLREDTDARWVDIVPGVPGPDRRRPDRLDGRRRRGQAAAGREPGRTRRGQRGAGHARGPPGAGRPRRGRRHRAVQRVGG